MIVNLSANEQLDLNLRAKTVVYLAGSVELLFVTEVGRFQIPAGGQVTMPSVFEKITIVNTSSSSSECELLFVEGEYQRLSDVSFVQIQGITNAITANIASLPSVAVNSLPAVTIDSLPAVTIDSLPSVAVSDLPEFVQKDVSNVLTTSYTVAAGGVITIPAKAGRKRAVIQGYTESLNTTICRISDSAKTAITGEFLAVGGGLLAESEHLHSAALKIWNPSDADDVEIVIREEF